MQSDQGLCAASEDARFHVGGRQVQELRLCLVRPLEQRDGPLHGGRQLRCEPAVDRSPVGSGRLGIKGQFVSPATMFAGRS